MESFYGFNHFNNNMEKTQNTIKYQDLYTKYKDLVNKTTIRAYSVTPNQKINVDNISIEDLTQREETEKELMEGLEFLTDIQLVDLSSDQIFAVQALNVLVKRKETI